jgi:hypothetical protein
MFKRIGPIHTFASPNEQGKKPRVTATRRTDKKFNKNLIDVKIVNKIGFVSLGKKEIPTAVRGRITSDG